MEEFRQFKLFNGRLDYINEDHISVQLEKRESLETAKKLRQIHQYNFQNRTEKYLNQF